MKIKLKFILGIVPVPVIITESIPEKFEATTEWLFIKMRYRSKDDVGLLAHELTHVEQEWRWIVLGLAISTILFFTMTPLWYLPVLISSIAHVTLYHLIEEYRFICEGEAYRNQMKADGFEKPPEWMISAMHSKYGFSAEIDYIEEYLSSK